MQNQHIADRLNRDAENRRMEEQEKQMLPVFVVFFAGALILASASRLVGYATGWM